MPIALDPQARATVVLKHDENAPADTQPKFFANFLTSRKSLQLSQEIEAAEKAPTDAEAKPLVLAILAKYIVGWENVIDPETKQPVPFSPDSFVDVLTDGELWSLMYRARRAMRLTEDEWGKSNLPLTSAGASTAKDASQPASA